MQAPAAHRGPALHLAPVPAFPHVPVLVRALVAGAPEPRALLPDPAKHPAVYVRHALANAVAVSATRR